MKSGIAEIFVRDGLDKKLADALAQLIWDRRQDLAKRVLANDPALRAAMMGDRWPGPEDDPNEVVVVLAPGPDGAAAILIEKLSPEQMRELLGE